MRIINLFLFSMNTKQDKLKHIFKKIELKIIV